MTKTKVYSAGKPCIQAVASAIAQAVRQPNDPLPPSYMPEGVACAFIGSSDRGGGKPAKEVLDFIGILDSKRVSRVVLFATSSGDASAVIASMKTACEARGLNVLPETFTCKGKGSFGGKVPTEADLSGIPGFVQKIEALV